MWPNDNDENIEGYNPVKKKQILIVFDNVIADMINNKNLKPILNLTLPKLFIRGRKVNSSVIFLTLIL